MARFEPPGTGARSEDAVGYTMTIAEVAVRLGVIPTTLKNWREAGVGPSWYKGPHRTSQILYRPAEVAEVKKAKDAHLKAETKREVSARITQANKASRSAGKPARKGGRR